MSSKTFQFSCAVKLILKMAKELWKKICINYKMNYKMKDGMKRSTFIHTVTSEDVE